MSETDETGESNPGPIKRLRVMGTANKTIITAIYVPALVYAGLALFLTIMTFGSEPATVIPGIAKLSGPYSGLLSEQPWGLYVAIIGFALSAAGMFTSEPLDVLGDQNRVQYLWTHRPYAPLICVAAPWGLISSAWKRNKFYAVAPIIALPLYAVWSAIISVALIIPFAIAWAVVSHSISKARKKERLEYRTSTRFAVCPSCRRKFSRPLVVSDGEMIDYPIPGKYGIKCQTTNKGRKIPCTHGTRGMLETKCPHCLQLIPTRESYPVCISLAGASGAGKTTLMLASAEMIMAAAKKIDITSETPTAGLSPDIIACRDSAHPTEPGAVNSECLFLKPLSGTGSEIVYSDISGSEFLARKDKDLFEEYYKYTDGIVFVFDPRFARTNMADLIDAFNSFYGMFSTIRGIAPGEPAPIRFAMVASKKDISGMENSDVRAYLHKNGGDALIRTVETLFEDVRYFSECGVGNRPKTAAAPILWIAEGAGMESAAKISASLDANI